MLTDKQLRGLKGREKPYKVTDGGGLSVLVRPDGALWWRFRYRYRGREKMLSFGVYPDVSLKRAREKLREAREQLDRGIDPSAVRQAEKEAQADTFEVLAREWLKLERSLKVDTISQLRYRLETYVLPTIGSLPVRDVTAKDLLRMLRRIEAKGTHETAHRVRSLCSRVFRYAVAAGRADRDPSADLRGALASVRTKNFASITDPKALGELLRAIDGYQGQPSVMAALKLAPLTFVRPGELRAAEWSEFDLEGKHPEWRIPAERMKMGEAHIVPLSRQAVAVLKELREVTGAGRLLFPSLRSAERPISDNTINAALRRLGYTKEQMTGHGFRSTASTLLNELGFHPDLIELQLAHKERNKVRAAYNRAERLAERRTMMQSWADYLEGLKADKRAKVRAIRG